MSRLLAAALLASLALPATAQTHLADSSGVYLGLGAGYSNVTGLAALTGSVGYRQSNGLDYGASIVLDRRLYSSTARTYDRYYLGSTFGYTAAIGAGALMRVEGSTGLSGLDVAYRSGSEDIAFTGNALSIGARATVSRPIRTIGSFRVHPTIGLYATAAQALGQSSVGLEVVPTLSGASVGIEAGVPLSFRLGGKEVTLPFITRIGLARSNGYIEPYSGSGGIRVNF